MNKVERTLTDNPVAKSNCHYSTHISRLRCCGQDPDLYAGSNRKGFLRSGTWKFVCSECGREGFEGLTPNSASAGWNEVLTTQDT